MPFPVEQKWIVETEQKLGIKFPAGFKDSMMQLNGGEVRTSIDLFSLHPFMDKTDRKRIQRTCNSICRETATARKWDYFPKELVVIGSNGGGDLLVLKPKETAPSVLEDVIYWWDHETSFVEPIADDFSDLKKT